MTAHRLRHFTTVAITLATLAGCHRPPSAQVEDWSIDRKDGDYVLSVEVKPYRMSEYGMSGRIKLFYSNGCNDEQIVTFFNYHNGSELIATKGPSGTFIATAPISVSGQVAGAHLWLGHKTNYDQDAVPFFDEAKVIDPAAQKKAENVKCKPRPAQRLPGSQSSQETVATIINLRGYLCGHVIDVYPRGPGQLIVQCVEYRNGRGRVKYLLNTDTASVERLD